MHPGFWLEDGVPRLGWRQLALPVWPGSRCGTGAGLTAGSAARQSMDWERRIISPKEEKKPGPGLTPRNSNPAKGVILDPVEFAWESRLSCGLVLFT